MSSIVLMLFLLLPSVVNFLHSTEKHDHYDRCENNSDIHIHEKELDCCLCDVTLKNNGVFTPTKEILFVAYQEISQKTIQLQTIYLPVYRTTDSRGPPAC